MFNFQEESGQFHTSKKLAVGLILTLFLQPGVSSSLLYNGSKFCGHQKSKGNQYDVEVVLQVFIQSYICYLFSR